MTQQTADDEQLASLFQRSFAIRQDFNETHVEEYESQLTQVGRAETGYSQGMTAEWRP